MSDNPNSANANKDELKAVLNQLKSNIGKVEIKDFQGSNTDILKDKINQLTRKNQK